MALTETIKIFHDDDALELSKKNLPGASASFMQLKVSNKAVQQKALALLQGVHGSAHVDLLDVAPTPTLLLWPRQSQQLTMRPNQ